MLRLMPNRVCLLGYSSKHAFWCNFVCLFIHAHQKRKKTKFSICAVDVAVCVRFRCVRRKLFTQFSTVPPTIPSVFYARLVPSGSPYIESWYVSLNENACVSGNAYTDIMWKCNRAKIKESICTTDIDILRMTSMHRIVRHRIDVSIHIDPYRLIVTPLVSRYLVNQRTNHSDSDMWLSHF